MWLSDLVTFYFISMKRKTDQSELIQEILSLPELKALLELQKTLEIRSNLLSQESGITAVDFSRLRTIVLGETGEKYKFLNLLNLKKLVQVILGAVKEQQTGASFSQLEFLVTFSEEENEILLKEEQQKLAGQKVTAAEVFERERDTHLFLAKVIQVFFDDAVVTKEQITKLALILLISEEKERDNILRLAQEYKIRHRDASVGNFLQIL